MHALSKFFYKVIKQLIKSNGFILTKKQSHHLLFRFAAKISKSPIYEKILNKASIMKWGLERYERRVYSTLLGKGYMWDRGRWTDGSWSWDQQPT